MQITQEKIDKSIAAKRGEGVIENVEVFIGSMIGRNIVCVIADSFEAEDFLQYFMTLHRSHPRFREVMNSDARYWLTKLVFNGMDEDRSFVPHFAVHPISPINK